MSRPGEGIVVQVGEEIRRRRRAAGLTLQDLGGAAGVDWSQLARIERGEGGTGLDRLEAITAVLGTDLAALFTSVRRRRRRLHRTHPSSLSA